MSSAAIKNINSVTKCIGNQVTHQLCRHGSPRWRQPPVFPRCPLVSGSPSKPCRMLYASMPSSVARLAAAMDRTPLRQSISAFFPALTAAVTPPSKSAFSAIPGHCFQASATAPGTLPTHSRSASVRTSTNTASPACTQAHASCGGISPAYPDAGLTWPADASADDDFCDGTDVIRCPVFGRRSGCKKGAPKERGLAAGA